MTPIVALAHCVCGIKLPLLSSQLPASNTAWLLCGDLPPPILPFSPSFSLSFTLSSQLFTSVLSVCLAPSYLFLQLPLLYACLKKINLLFFFSLQWGGTREEGGRVFFNKRGVGKEVKGWNDTGSQRKPKTKEGEMNWHIRHRSMTHFLWLLFNAWVIFELPLELIYTR